MSTYNERLQTNNADLQKLVTDVNALPDYVPPKPEQTKSVTYTTNGSHTVTPDNGKVLSSVSIDVNVPSKTPVIKPITITKNGTVTAPSGVDGYSPITVEVPTGGGGGAKSFTVGRFEDMGSDGRIVITGTSPKWSGGVCADDFILFTRYKNLTITDTIQASLVFDAAAGTQNSTGLILSCGSDLFDVIAFNADGARQIAYSGGAYYVKAYFSTFVIRPKVDGAVADSIAIGLDV